jgi:hypothetical protein
MTAPAIEVALKAVLTARGHGFRRAHNLGALAGPLVQAGEVHPNAGDLLPASSLRNVVATMIEWANGRVVDINEKNLTKG